MCTYTYIWMYIHIIINGYTYMYLDRCTVMTELLTYPMLPVSVHAKHSPQDRVTHVSENR